MSKVKKTSGRVKDSDPYIVFLTPEEWDYYMHKGILQQTDNGWKLRGCVSQPIKQEKNLKSKNG